MHVRIVECSRCGNAGQPHAVSSRRHVPRIVAPPPFVDNGTFRIGSHTGRPRQMARTVEHGARCEQTRGARLQATAAPDAPDPMTNTSTISFMRRPPPARRSRQHDVRGRRKGRAAGSPHECPVRWTHISYYSRASGVNHDVTPHLRWLGTCPGGCNYFGCFRGRQHRPTGCHPGPRHGRGHPWRNPLERCVRRSRR